MVGTAEVWGWAEVVLHLLDSLGVSCSESLPTSRGFLLFSILIRSPGSSWVEQEEVCPVLWSWGRDLVLVPLCWFLRATWPVPSAWSLRLPLSPLCICSSPGALGLFHSTVGDWWDRGLSHALPRRSGPPWASRVQLMPVGPLHCPGAPSTGLPTSGLHTSCSHSLASGPLSRLSSLPKRTTPLFLSSCSWPALLGTLCGVVSLLPLSCVGRQTQSLWLWNSKVLEVSNSTPGASTLAGVGWGKSACAGGKELTLDSLAPALQSPLPSQSSKGFLLSVLKPES